MPKVKKDKQDVVVKTEPGVTPEPAATPTRKETQASASSLQPKPVTAFSPVVPQHQTQLPSPPPGGFGSNFPQQTQLTAPPQGGFGSNFTPSNQQPTASQHQQPTQQLSYPIPPQQYGYIPDAQQHLSSTPSTGPTLSAQTTEQLLILAMQREVQLTKQINKKTKQCHQLEQKVQQLSGVEPSTAEPEASTSAKKTKKSKKTKNSRSPNGQLPAEARTPRRTSAKKGKKRKKAKKSRSTHETPKRSNKRSKKAADPMTPKQQRRADAMTEGQRRSSSLV